MPSLFSQPMAVALLLLAGSMATAQAGSIGASSAAGGSSASAGSSASSEASSNSSGGRHAAAAGPYRILAVTDLADQPGRVQLQLQALAADAPDPVQLLVLPRAIAAQFQLAAGQTVTARPQAYGTEFVHDASRQAFFLVLTAGFQRELDSRPVRL
jgi:hypothetical protein